MPARRLEPTVFRLNPAAPVVHTAHPWRTVTVHPLVYALLGVLVMFATIEGSKAVGFWTTSGRITGSGQPVVISGNDPLEIKGWMTLDQIAGAYGVPLDELKAGTGIPADAPGTTELRQVERLAPGFSAQTVRDWLLTRQRRR